MNKFQVYLANTSLFLVMLYAFLTILFVYHFKAPALGVAYCLALASILFFVSFLVRIPNSISLELKVAFLIAVFGAISLIGQSVTQKDYFDYLGRSVQEFARSVYTMNTLWLFSGLAVGRCVFGRSNLSAIVIMFGVGFLISKNLGDGFLVSYSDIADEGFEGVNHLLVVDMILMISYFVFSISYGIIRLPILFLIGAFAFAGGGRSSFYLGLFVPIFYELIWGGVKNRNLLIGILLTCVFSISYLIIDGANESIQRMLFSGGVAEDMSYSERSEYFYAGLSALLEQSLFGDPGWIVRTYGTAGAYIHNILSAWQFFGFLPFILLVLLVFFLLRKIRYSKIDFKEPANMFGLLCIAYAVMGICLSRFIGFSFLWFALGFWVYRFQSSRQLNGGVRFCL